MTPLADFALWLAWVMSGWAAATAMVGGARDARLTESGARALHVVAVLALMAAVGGAVPWRQSSASLLGTCLAVAGGAAALLARKAERSHRRRTHLRAAALAGLGIAVALGAAAIGAGAEGEPLAAGLVVPAGVAFRVLYCAGIAVGATAAVIAHVPRSARPRHRLVMLALTACWAGLLLGAWTRYGIVTRAPELDAGGQIVATPWTTTHLLLFVPVLVLVAGVMTLRARAAGGAHSQVARSRVASVLLLLVAAICAGVAIPAIADWVADRDVSLGVAMEPLRGAGAIAASVAASALALALLARLRRGPAMAEIAQQVAAAGAMLTVAFAVAAMSSRPRQLEIAPGASARVGDWRLVSQGTSQEERDDFAAALVAFEIERGGSRSILRAGERVYRDAQGHRGTRVAVPAVVRAIGGDLRLTVRALRGDVALVHAQYHPLASFAWAAAALTLVSLTAAVVTLRARHTGESRP